MPRPKAKVTDKNVDDIYKYFSVFFAENRAFWHMHGDNDYNASLRNLINNKQISEEFNNIKKHERDKKLFIELLQKWIDAYVPEKLRVACFRSLNQKKYADNHKTKVVRISASTMYAIERYAELKHISLEDAIYEAVSAEYWRIKGINY